MANSFPFLIIIDIRRLMDVLFYIVLNTKSDIRKLN